MDLLWTVLSSSWLFTWSPTLHRPHPLLLFCRLGRVCRGGMVPPNATTRVVSAGTVLQLSCLTAWKSEFATRGSQLADIWLTDREVETRRNLPLVKAIPAPYPPFRAFSPRPTHDSTRKPG